MPNDSEVTEAEIPLDAIQLAEVDGVNIPLRQTILKRLPSGQMVFFKDIFFVQCGNQVVFSGTNGPAVIREARRLNREAKQVRMDLKKALGTGDENPNSQPSTQGGRSFTRRPR